MRKPLSLAAVALLGVLAITTAARSHEQHDADHAAEAAAKSPVNLETLMKAKLEGAKGTEVIVSRVTLAPHASLPKHWHPGEEFAYVLEGTVTLWQKGKEDMVVKAGEAASIPLKQVHTAMTGDEGATVLVFRVHEEGKPERVLVEE